ncbi:hypothetical protein SDC9_161262 [bioreactor metagenome]|uniref:Uncharacterized protein n=1 Tax=bioreactor metagenome TaxID=1076179 RepID=A0A645FJU7_9ZZZZ
MYGSKPSNYSAMKSASSGVQKGSGKSLAVAGEILFYLSRAGIVAYTGGIPDSSTSKAFGSNALSLAIAGGDKNSGKYYLSAKQSDGTYALFVFDTRSKLWHKEDNTQAVGFAYLDNLYMLKSNGEMWIVGNTDSIPQGAASETSVSSMVEFCDFIDKDPNKKGVSKLQLRLELEAGATLKASIKFDSSGTWEEVKTLTAGKKRSYYLPIIPRRTDYYRLKLEGVGMWRLHSLVREVYSGSEL